jgi:hypothetical protein
METTQQPEEGRHHTEGNVLGPTRNHPHDRLEHLMREAIRRTQPQSMAIRHTPPQSMAIRGTRTQSDAIRRNPTHSFASLASLAPPFLLGFLSRSARHGARAYAHIPCAASSSTSTSSTAASSASSASSSTSARSARHGARRVGYGHDAARHGARHPLGCEVPVGKGGGPRAVVSTCMLGRATVEGGSASW